MTTNINAACKGRIRRLGILATLLISVAAGALGQDEDSIGSVSGSFKSLFYLVYDANYSESTAGLAATPFRVNGSLYPSDWLSLEAAYRISPEVASPTLSDGGPAAPATIQSEYRIADLSDQAFPPEIEDADGAAVYQDLDRLFAGISLSFVDIYIGRQAIAWGSARVVRPTDVLVPVGFTEVDTGYRVGVDAIRLRFPVGGFNEIDLGSVFGDDLLPRESAYYLRPSFYLWETDLTLLAMLFRENLLGGISVSRAIGEAGAWLEAAYVVPDAVNAPDDPYAQDYLSVSVGADRNLASDVYGYVEYHYNSAGSLNPDGYLTAAAGPAYSEGNIYLLGQHYLGIGGTYTAAPLLPVDALFVVNLTDGSAEAVVSAEYNFQENVYIGGGMILGLGPEPDTTGGVPTEYQTEFGAYPQMFYTEVKLYF